LPVSARGLQRLGHLAVDQGFRMPKGEKGSMAVSAGEHNVITLWSLGFMAACVTLRDHEALLGAVSQDSRSPHNRSALNERLTLSRFSLGQQL